jgi:hypothetical protein
MPGGPGVGDGGGLGRPDAEHAAGGGGGPGPHAHQDAGGPGAHEVAGGLVAGAAADDHGDVEAAHEGLEVERVAVPGDVLGGDHRALHHEQIELGGQEGVGEGREPLGVMAAHDTTPAARISLMRSRISSGLMGSA